MCVCVYACLSVRVCGLSAGLAVLEYDEAWAEKRTMLGAGILCHPYPGSGPTERLKCEPAFRRKFIKEGDFYLSLLVYCAPCRLVVQSLLPLSLSCGAVWYLIAHGNNGEKLMAI